MKLLHLLFLLLYTSVLYAQTPAVCTSRVGVAPGERRHTEYLCISSPQGSQVGVPGDVAIVVPGAVTYYCVSENGDSTPSNTCWTTTAPGGSICGDGKIDPEISEECDIGLESVCASGNCRLPGEVDTTPANQCMCVAPGNTCGDGSVVNPEVCDCGGSSTSCSAPGGQCSGLTSPRCEDCQCVVGNTTNPVCGNGTIETGEVCDPGGVSCSVNSDCGQQGICGANPEPPPTNICNVNNGSCTSGCTPTCTCASNTVCPAGTDKYVRTDGNDSASGANDTTDPSTGAWRTLNKAITSAVPGTDDIVCIKGGTYKERNLSVTAAPANEGQRIRFVGVSDASGNKLSIIDGKRDEPGGWTLDTSVCSNCYRKTINYSTGAPQHGTFCVNGNCGYVVRYRSDQADWQSTLTSGPNFDASCCCCSTNATRSFNAADVIYTVQGGVTYVRFADNSNPNSLASGRELGFTAKESIINTNGLDFLTFENLGFKNAWGGIHVESGSTDVYVLDSRFTNLYVGVWPDGGSARTTVQRNFCTLNYHKSFTNLSGTGTVTHKGSDPKHWLVWRMIKKGEDSDPTCVRTQTTGTVTGPVLIEDNIGQDLYQLYSNDTAVLTCPSSEAVCINIRNNTCTNTIDDCLDFQRGTMQRVQVRDNISIDANAAIRMSVDPGPIWLYRNRAYAPESGGTFAEGLGIYLYDGTTGSQLIYHNSFLTRGGIYVGSGGPRGFAIGLPNTEVYNNIVSGGPAHTTYYSYSSVYNGLSSSLKLKWDYNWSTDAGTGSLTNNIASQNRSLWTPNVTPNFEPPVGTGSTDPRGKADDVNSAPPASQPWRWVGDTRTYNQDMGALQYVAAGVTTTSTSTTSTASGATTTTTTLPTDGSPAVDWTNSFCLYRFEETTNNPRVAVGSCAGDTSPTCSMNEESGVDIPQNTSEFREGASSVDFTVSNTRLTNSRCATMSAAGSASWGCWTRQATQGAARYFWTNNDSAEASGSGAQGFRLGFTSGNAFHCRIGDGNDAVSCDRGDVGTSTSTWTHYGCVHAAGATDTIQLYDDGAATGATCAQQDMVAPTSGTHKFSRTTGNSWTGQLDECWRANTALTANQFCRIASCGVAGEYCTCAAAPANYKSCSADADCRNCSGCSAKAICDGSTCSGRSAVTCTLGDACNAAAP